MMGGVLGLAGAALLVFGIILALKRESLTIDFDQKSGVLRRWSLSGSETLMFEFRLEQVSGVHLKKRIESVSDGDGPETRHLKWELLLHVQPDTFIPLCRSVNRGSIHQLAEEVCQSLGLKLTSK